MKVGRHQWRAIERGVYGRLLAGNPAPPGLEAAFTVTLPVAGFFRLLGDLASKNSWLVLSRWRGNADLSIGTKTL